uniref:Rho-GAP domain-containing protein n=1 Tax=Arcella intermedia TaxID=1963864 RepID=A0A6B2KYI0_9EUKA
MSTLSTNAWKRKSMGPSVRRADTQKSSDKKVSEPPLAEEEEPAPNFVATFGSNMDDLVNFEHNFLQAPPVIPSIIEKSFQYLMTGLNTEGLFRVPGNNTVTSKVKRLMDIGRSDLVDFLANQPEMLDMPDVASLLKLYLRLLPEPLFTRALEGEFLSILEITEPEAKYAKFRQLFVQLSQLTQQVCKKLFFLFFQVSLNSYKNKMPPANIAVVFGEMAGVFTTAGTRSGDLLSWIISNYGPLFEEEDMNNATGLLLCRTFAGHDQKIIGLLSYEDYILSFDTTGVVQIWNSVTYTFYSTFLMDLELCTLPVVWNSRLWCLSRKSLRVWEMSDILDLNSSTAQYNQINLEVKTLSNLLVVNEEMWIIGDNIVVLDKENNPQVLSELPSTGKLISLVKDMVWITTVNEMIEIWDPSTKTKVKSLEGVINGTAEHILLLENLLCITGEKEKVGVMWIFEPQSCIFLKTVSSSHSGPILKAAVLQNHICTVSNDHKMIIWNSEFVELSTIPVSHSNAITQLLIFPTKNGFKMWSSSEDKTISVDFLPESYIQKINSKDHLEIKRPLKSRLPTMLPYRAAGQGDGSESLHPPGELTSSPSIPGITSTPPVANNLHLSSSEKRARYSSRRSLQPRNPEEPVTPLNTTKTIHITSPYTPPAPPPVIEETPAMASIKRQEMDLRKRSQSSNTTPKPKANHHHMSPPDSGVKEAKKSKRNSSKAPKKPKE